MTSVEFSKFLSAKMIKLSETASKKGPEYSFPTGDRFHSFELIAKDLEELFEKPVDKAQAAYSMALKHKASIVDILVGKEVKQEVLDEKFGDMIIYLFIIWAILSEERYQAQNLAEVQGYNLSNTVENELVAIEDMNIKFGIVGVDGRMGVKV